MTFPYPYEVVPGTAALQRLDDLRAAGQGTPVILGGREQFERSVESYGCVDSTPEDLVAQASELDPLAWLAEREEAELEYYEIDAADWPEDASPNESLTAHLDISTGEPLDQVYITVLPTNTSWAAACYLKTGGWNNMPFAHEHAALWRHWEEQYGAKIACIANDTIEFTVARPPRTRDEAMALARQQYIYCADIVHQGVQSVEALAATVLDAPVWFFWWD